jgi:hypothetical protein
MTKKKKEFDHGDRESRRRRACERLGTDKPSCMLCEQTDPFVIELHHVAGRKYHDEMIPACLNHHAQASELAKDHLSKIDGCTNPLESVGHFLLGLGDLAQIVADELRDPMLADFLIYLRLKLREFGLFLIEFARRAPNLEVGLVP